jgi:hypothetical protein
LRCEAIRLWSFGVLSLIARLSTKCSSCRHGRGGSSAVEKIDQVTDGTETAIMTLQPGSGYKVGNKNQATVSILDGP